jgi:hypothetical protein
MVHRMKAQSMKLIQIIVGATILDSSVTVSFAQDRKTEQAIKHRRAAFTVMSTYFSRLLQTVEGDTFRDCTAAFDPLLPDRLKL